MSKDQYMHNWTKKMINYWETFLIENPDSKLRPNVKEALKTLRELL